MAREDLTVDEEYWGGGGLQKMLGSQVIDFQKAASEIVIYNKKYIYLVFTPLLAQSF